MSKFKVGEKVYVKEVGRWAKVIKYSELLYFIKDEHGKKGYIEESYLERFIEPKYKVGDKVYAFPVLTYSEDKAEIVKCSLNKKRGEYSYLTFKTDTGFPIAMNESDVILYGTRPKPEVKEMTMEQVCRELGKEIKIIKK